MWPRRRTRSKWLKSCKKKRKKTEPSESYKITNDRPSESKKRLIKNQAPFSYLRLLCGHAAHLLWVQLHRVVPQLGLGRRLQVVASHRQVAVSLDPPGAVDKEARSRIGSSKNKRDGCESGADLKESMWMAWLALYSPWLSFWKPISLCMFSP